MNSKHTPKQLLFNSKGQPIGFFIKTEDYNNLLAENAFLKDKVEYYRHLLTTDITPDEPKKEIPR